MEIQELVKKVVMPRLSLTMKEGTVTQWHKKEGESVEKGEPLVEVLTEKVVCDIEAPASGVLRKILVKEGTDVPVAETLAIIAAPGEELPRIEAAAEAPVEEAKEVVEVKERVAASPAARRLAREYDVDLAKVKGTGPKGRIRERDVKRYVEEGGFMPRVREVIPLTGIRKVVAERVSLSARTAPHSTITMEADMSNAVKFHEENKVSYTDMLVKAAAGTLAEYPIMNSTLRDDQIKILGDLNIGVAVATERGLVVPVVRNADKKSLTEVSSTLKQLIERARKGKLAKEDITGGTFTITNLGMFEVDVFTPIINPPETAILGAGRIAERPVVIGGKIAVRPIMHLSLSFDHRIVDGVPAAQFLQKVKKILENPHLLLT